MLNESGVAGADRVKSRQDFKQFLASYQHVLSKFPGFVSMTPSGSYNSNPDKQDFGDIDLVVHIQSDKDKATVKKELQAFFTKMPETVIVPFSSAKHAGKRTYNAGELISVRYHDDALGYSAQVDNIVALDAAEASFKQSFLDMPAEEQGLILGLTKIATIETDPAVLFQKLGIKVKEPLAQDQEYEFNLSGVELQLRKVTYEPGTFKQLSREVLWNSKNFDDVQKLLFQYDLKAGFGDLLQQCKRNIRNPRSGERMKGVFASMISVKSGEVGTPKGAGKEAALAKIQQTFKENRSIFRSLMENNNKKIVFAFGRFQPPTIGHELLITSVKHIAEQQGAEYVIYVSKTQDNKSNPLSVEQKIAYLRKMFPGTNFVACDATIRTPIEAAKALNGKYQELIMVAGSDRVPSFEKLLNDYNGKEYQYAMLRVVSAGERDPDSDEVSGMSGTKMRAAAVAGDLQSFMQGLPGTMNEQDATNLMTLIQQGLQKPVKTKKGVAEGFPNFNREWDEATRYPEFVNLGKEKWIELVSKGKQVTVTRKNVNKINNTDAADPKSFKLLDPEKQKRALAQLANGDVEMPIVARYSDGYLELIGGNTRLTAQMAKDGQAKVWLFNVPEELTQGVAEEMQHKKITELFDPKTSFPLQWDEQFASSGEVHAEAHDADGRTIDISFTPTGYGGGIEIVFKRGGSYDMTGQGDASRVLATVVNAISQYLQKYQPPYIAFSAKSTGGRAGAYAAMIKRLARGYTLLDPEEYPEDTAGFLDYLGSDKPFILARSGQQGVAEGEADYGAAFQDKVKRLGQMAKQGERKTVWDPVKRVYKTVPVNAPKNNEPVKEKMMPASTFAGSKTNKLGPAGQLKGNMKRPAKAGDLVGGSAEESFDGGSIAAKKPGYSGEANYTAQPNWRGQNIGEDVEIAMALAIARLIESQLK